MRRLAILTLAVPAALVVVALQWLCGIEWEGTEDE